MSRPLQPTGQLDKDVEEEAIPEECDQALLACHATPKLHVSVVLVIFLGVARMAFARH